MPMHFDPNNIGVILRLTISCESMWQQTTGQAGCQRAIIMRVFFSKWEI